MKRIYSTLVFCLVVTTGTLIANEDEIVTCAWYHWDPYQYLNESNRLTGLDVALVKRIFAESEIDVVYDTNSNSDWDKNQNDVLIGEKDIAAGAFSTPERRKVYNLSLPYRYEWNALYVASDSLAAFDVENVESLLKLINDRKYRIGVIRGYKYTSSAINKFVSSSIEKTSPLVIESITEEESFKRLHDREVDIVISDRLVGAQVLWKKKWGSEIHEHSLALPAKPIHLLIHKSNDPNEQVRLNRLLKAFNEGVKKLTANGIIDNVTAEYLFPVLMNITVQRNWFYLIEVVGAVFFVVAGLLIARDSGYDFFGSFVVSTLLAAGGGLMRDLIVGRDPIFLKDSVFIDVILFVTSCGFLLLKLYEYLLARSGSFRKIVKFHGNKWLFVRELIEAIALGAYTVVGVGVAVEMRMDPLWIWGPLMGCLTSCGGGVVASAMSRFDKMNAMNGKLDPEFSLFWGTLLSFFLLWQTHRLNPKEVFWGVVFTILGTCLFVLFARYKRYVSPVLSKAALEGHQ